MEEKFENCFGPHLVLDGYGCSRKKLENMDLIYKLLDKFPSAISMTKMTKPNVFKYIGSKPEDWGISGFVLIAESHISIHTFPEKGYLSLDIFSCRNFDIKKAVGFIKNIFEMKKINYKVLNRGTEFPKNIQIVTEHIRKERNKLIPYNSEKQ